MELNFKNDIKNWLDNLDILKPKSTGFCPILKTDSPAKAVIFDIYGTLIISSSGDIDQALMTEENMERALEAGGIHVSASDSSLLQFLLDQLQAKIKSNQEEMKLKGYPYPEVDIFKVWNDMFAEATKADLLKLSGSESLTDVIMVFELLSNQVFPMPGMKEVLEELTKKGVPLGIVSNAQFYTPIIMNYFLTGEFTTSQNIKFFDPDLTVYSFREFRAKPDIKLFDKIITTLSNKYNLNSEDAVFVGNDMLKDVYTASNSGLRTVLFSGDERSLRTREGDQRVKGLYPDFFVNDLKQILEIVV